MTEYTRHLLASLSPSTVFYPGIASDLAAEYVTSVYKLLTFTGDSYSHEPSP